MLNCGSRWLVVFLCLCAGSAGLAAPAPGAKLTAEQIVQRAVHRAQFVYSANRQTNYVYDKTSVTEELDGRGRVTHRKEKVFECVGGASTLKELKIDGKTVPPRELRKIEEQSAAERHQNTRGHASRRDDNWSKYLTKEITGRFTFELVGEEEIAGRPAYVLSFEPRSDKLPVKQVTDRLINRVAGKVWIDTREFEVAKAEVGLIDEVTMWGGMLGAMKRFAFDLERTRMDDSVWFNRVTNFQVEGRKLFDRTHMRIRSESGNFRKAPGFK